MSTPTLEEMKEMFQIFLEDEGQWMKGDSQEDIIAMFGIRVFEIAAREYGWDDDD